MADYTREYLGSYEMSDPPSGQSSYSISIGPGQGATTTYYDYKVFYSKVKFLRNGTATLGMGVYHPNSRPVVVYAQAGPENTTFDTSTGAISPRLTSYQTGIGSAQAVYFMSLDVSAGSTYEFYFAVEDSQMDYYNGVILFPYMRFEPYNGPVWQAVYDSLGRVDTTLTKVIPSSEQSEYTLYCYYLSTNLTSGTFTIQTTTVGQMYLTSRGDDTVFSHRTGEIPEENYIAYAQGPDGKIEIRAASMHGVYLWIRHDWGTSTDEISFTIYPPGATWSTNQIDVTYLRNAEWSNTYNPGSITEKTVEYIQLGATAASVYATYEFKCEGTDRMLAYLTTSLEVDSNGYPSGTIVASDTSSSTGFTISATTGNMTYYLMFRTPNGSPNTGSYTITIKPSDRSFAYTKASDSTDIYNTRTVQITVSSSSTEYTGQYFRTTYLTSGTVRVTLTSRQISDLVVYKVEGGDYGFNSATGAPYVSSSHSEEAGGSSVAIFNVVSGQDYYLWVRGVPPYAAGNLSVSVNISFTELSWSYVDYTSQTMLERATLTQEYPLSEKTGARFKMSCKYAGDAVLTLLGMNSATIYITQFDYGFNSDGIPYTDSARSTLATGSRNHTISVVMEREYYVWISPGSSSSSGTARVQIEPPTITVTWELDDRTSDTSMTDLSVNPSPKWISLSRAHTALYVVSFANSGDARFRSDGNVEVSIYFADSTATIAPEDGIPEDYDASDIGEEDFDLTVTVTAGITYYIWIKGNDEFVEGGTYLDVTVPENVSGTRGFYIYVNVISNNYEWAKTTPYIDTNSGWTEAKGYVYSSGAWPDQY